MHALYTTLRNLFCGSLAMAVIASGRVGRAKRRTLSSNVVTAIYFHNPNKRLFAKCMKWLTGNGYTFISADELMNILHRGEQPPKGAVWLSCDDGFKRFLTAVLPVISERTIPITIFLPSGIIAGDGLFPWLHVNRCWDEKQTAKSRNGLRDSITVDDLKMISMYSQVTIGSHTVRHAITAGLSHDKLRFDITECKRDLESWTGRTVTCFAYPEGRFDGAERYVLKEAGYQLAATTQPTFIALETDPYTVPRFNVGDEIWLPEAICNMTGVWRSAIDPVQHLSQSVSRLLSLVRDFASTRDINSSRPAL